MVVFNTVESNYGFLLNDVIDSIQLVHDHADSRCQWHCCKSISTYHPC